MAVVNEEAVMSTTARYRDAITWIALNDDTEFLKDDEIIPSVTVCMVADIFAVTTDEVISDLRVRIAKAERDE